MQEAAVEAQPPLDLHGAPQGHVILHPLLPGKPHLLHPALVPRLLLLQVLAVPLAQEGLRLLRGGESRSNKALKPDLGPRGGAPWLYLHQLLLGVQQRLDFVFGLRLFRLDSGLEEQKRSDFRRGRRRRKGKRRG